MKSSACFVLFAVLLASGAESATIYVPDDLMYINDALAVASHGDTIIVRPGTYLEDINFIGKAVTLRSEAGPEVTTILGSGWYSPVVTFDSREALGSGVEDPPVSTIYGDLFLQFPLLAILDLGTMPPEGFVSITGPAPGTWVAGEEKPFQALVGSELGNLLVLEVE